MKKNLLLLILVIITTAFIYSCTKKECPNKEINNLEKVSLRTKWLVQGQFAGYYVAKDKGFYQEEGLDVTINEGGPDVNPAQMVLSGVDDFGVKWLAEHIIDATSGKDVVSIAQIFQKNGLLLLTKKKHNIKTPKDFIGKKIGLWLFANELQFMLLMHQQRIDTKKLEIIEQKIDIDPFLKDQMHIASAMHYNEFITASDFFKNNGTPDELQVIDFDWFDLDFPGDLIITKKETLEKRPLTCEKFVRASIKGWDWAIKNPKEAAEIVVKNAKGKNLDIDFQTKQIIKVGELIRFQNRYLGYQPREKIEAVYNYIKGAGLVINDVGYEAIFHDSIIKKIQEK